MQPAKRTTEERVIGCLLGGALGDAWGGAWEGRVGPQSFEIPAHSRVSDDTQLTLATCESIVSHGLVKPELLAAHFAEWFVQGKIPGIGSSTLKAMRDLSAGVHWALAGNRGEYSAGSGAAMRIAPLAFLLDPTRAGERTIIRDVCRITHHNEEAYVGALAVVLAIRSVLIGTWSREHSFLELVVGSLPDSAVRDRIETLIQLQLAPAEAASRFGASGHVVASVPLALSCAQYIAEDPLPVVLARAITGGGDTDTIASLTGQIAGTVVSAAGVSRDYFTGVEDNEEIFRIARGFAQFASSQGD
ncbi:MAG TPA: ADP-ribosylglycohydrolase family protein [Candidatus Binatus sp.]|nr:ADP-ribosylglycohydrolase family protein [Candidatus Binatus sp.]